MTRLRDILQKKPHAIGTLVSISSPQVAEALSHTGLEWLFFDMEHSTQNYGDVQAMIQSMNPDCLSFIRTRDASPTTIKQALDTGCDGIIVPQVNSPELAKQVVAAAFYPPEGERSIGLGRSSLYGPGLTDAIKEHNKRISVHVQIEHKTAISNLDAIAAVKGIDGLFVGPYDLSGSYGIPGEIDNSQIQEDIQKAMETAKANNLVAGIFCGSEEAAISEHKRGFQFITAGADILRLCNSCTRTAETFGG